MTGEGAVRFLGEAMDAYCLHLIERGAEFNPDDFAAWLESDPIGRQHRDRINGRLDGDAR